MKNFTNNLKQFTSRLSARWLIMALMLLVGTSSAWAFNQSAGTIYYDATNTPGVINNDKCYFIIGHGSHATRTTLSRVSGTQHLYKGSPAKYDNADGWYIFYQSSGYTENINKWVYSGDLTSTCTYGSAFTSNRVYKGSSDYESQSAENQSSKKRYKWESNYAYTTYKVTINSVTGGSLTVKDFDGTAVSSGASKSILTVLKFSATPSGGYDFTEVQINNGSSTTTISAADLSSKTYTITSNVTITPVWEKPCTPPDAPSLTNPDPLCGGSITLPESANEVNLKWYDAQTGGNVVSNTEITATGTYWAAAVAECESTSRTEYTVTINPIPEVNSLLSTLNICIGSIDETDLTTLSHVEVSSGSTAVWYTSEDGVEQAERANLINGGTYWVAAENSTTGCKSTTRTSFTININDLPQHPSLGKYEYETCAHASNTVSLNELAGVSDVIWFLGEEEVNEEVSIETAGIYTYTAKAVNANGCQSATGVDFKLTVNSLPTITSITASNDKPVPFEDVELTATGNDIASVEWDVDKGTITADPADSKKAILAHSSAESVTVTATATSANGCTASTTKSVTFSAAENCADVTTTKEETVGKIKLLLNKPSWIGSGEKFYCYAWENNTTNKLLGEWPGAELTQKEGSYYVIIVDSNNKNIKIILNDGSEQTVDSDVLNANKIYQISDTSSKNSDNKYTFNSKTDKGTYKESITTTVPAPIIAPAVKMVSAKYDEVNDKIVAKGAVYKTGCGTTFWGFQYSRNGQTWGTADVDFIHPSGNSLSVPGEFEYSFPIPGANGGETYYIIAYALNNYKGSYALSNAVYSTTSLPVEIPSKTIESATIALVEPSTDTEVCPQSTVYLKVSYVGGDFTDFVAEEDFPGTDLKLVNHDKVNNYAIFSFTATATGTANITISNKSGSTVTPADGVSITLKDVQVATPPTIYLEKNTICDNQTTNVVVNSPIIGFIYSLKNGSVGDPVTCESEDLKFEVSKEGSYTVQVQETVCGTTAISAPVDLRVITSDVKITLTTDVNTITPWQPLTLTVKAPSGYDYYLKGLDDETVYTKSGDVYTIKFRRPESWGVGNSKPDSEPETKTFIAGIKIGGEEDLCSTTTKEIQLVDTEEVCLAPGN